VDSADPSIIGGIREALSASNAKGLVPLSGRFLSAATVGREPYVLAARIDALGRLACKTNWVTEAWEESRERHQSSLGPAA
jgi:hypothetical protein